ncbi:VOC family protein [Natronorubrum aibiense]|uniref:VOC family protein n=1 Tax=Natronorubrum aibiense TaxID=348826 RepID=A0A5P9P9Y4_9EURY|nr:VOC family protein [Natronorubrum aibiense]QFU84690.1 VOC family protein [Natronorubrum aibiense]
MTATGFTHVTVYGDDIDELTAFYTDVFGLERIQAPNLGNPVVWLRCGDRQLHLVSRETEPPTYHHFALAVDDFEAVFDAARERDCFDEALAPEDGYPLYQLPDDAVQLYLRDPAGNLVEVDWPDVATLEDRIKTHVIDRSDAHPQSAAQAEARLFLDSSLIDDSISNP